MAKRYDPIMCMMVEEPTKAQDESYVVRGKKYKVVKRDGDNVTVIGPDGKVTKMHIDFLMSEGVKTKDRTFGSVVEYYNLMAGKSKSEVERILASAEGNPNAYLAYKKWKAKYDKAKDSNALDEAIKTADGMFASAFGEYTKGAKFKKDKFLKELAGISDEEEFAKRMQTLDNELKNNLERLDEAYNVASKDYYAARNEIRSIMDAFSREAFSLYKKLDKK